MLSIRQGNILPIDFLFFNEKTNPSNTRDVQFEFGRKQALYNNFYEQITLSNSPIKSRIYTNSNVATKNNRFRQKINKPRLFTNSIIIYLFLVFTKRSPLIVPENYPTIWKSIYIATLVAIMGVLTNQCVIPMVYPYLKKVGRMCLTYSSGLMHLERIIWI